MRIGHMVPMVSGCGMAMAGIDWRGRGIGEDAEGDGRQAGHMVAMVSGCGKAGWLKVKRFTLSYPRVGGARRPHAAHGDREL